MDSEIFEKLPPTKLFFRCAVPSMITMVFGALYQIADGLFVGRFIGEDALAAVNLIMPIIMMVFAFSNMVATGAAVRISVLLGEKKREEASRVFTFSLKFIFILFCIITVLGLVFAEPFVRLLAPGATEQAIEYGITYIRFYAMFSPLLPIYFATDNYLRVCGKEKISMWISISTQALNIGLDVILIAFLRQGVWAAAFTSCISMAIGAVITLWLFRGKRMDLYYIRGKMSLLSFSHVLANGSSEFFSNISVSIMAVAYNFFLLKYGGTTALAAFSVIMYVDSIIGMKLFSLSYITGWVDMCFSSFFTALERPVRSLLTSFFGTLVFPIGFLFILTPIWKLNGVFLTAFFASTASAIVTIIFALTMKKKQRMLASKLIFFVKNGLEA